MFCALQSCVLVGIEPQAVTCEVNLAPQLPAFSLVGLPSSITQESKERIRAAVVNSGFEWPDRKVTINLLPAHLPKWGSHFELSMALGILCAARGNKGSLQVFVLGELSLSGVVRPCGWLPMIHEWIRKTEPGVLIAHHQDMAQLSKLNGRVTEKTELISVENLSEAFQEITTLSARLKPTEVAREVKSQCIQPSLELLTKVRNEPLAVTAALVALAKKHHVLFAGPFGMGKTMLIDAVCQAAQPLSEEELTQRLSLSESLSNRFLAHPTRYPRPVVPLQTSISRAALEGSLLTSGQVLPGELTAAHHGILVANELLEFRRDVVEAFRQPLEEGIVRLQRAEIRTILPAEFQLLASTNLCPCGSFGKTREHCHCKDYQRISYQAKLSGPLLDRFDCVVLVGDEKLQIPKDLQDMVEKLLDQKNWEACLQRVWSAPFESDSDEPMHLWAEVTCLASNRGKIKIAQVSKTLAALLNEPRTSRHLRLAMLLRANIHEYFRQQYIKDRFY